MFAPDKLSDRIQRRSLAEASAASRAAMYDHRLRRRPLSAAANLQWTQLRGAELAALAAASLYSQGLLDTVAAASFTEDAIDLLARKQGKCRLLANPALKALDRNSLDTAPRQRQVRGGMMQQPNYTFMLNLEAPGVQRFGALSAAHARDLLLAWAIGSTSHSNTITLVRDGQLLGNGVGQQDRVGGCSLAVSRAREAGHETTGSVAYSDSFFSFPDAPQVLIDDGVRAIFCTTGSVRDELVRQRMLDAGIAVVQMPDRDARGFFGH